MLAVFGDEMNRLIAFWHSLFVYRRFLENEVDRLREENRSLLKSMLAVGGYTPFEGPQSELKPVSRKPRLSRQQWQAKMERESFQRADTVQENKGN